MSAKDLKKTAIIIFLIAFTGGDQSVKTDDPA